MSKKRKVRFSKTKAERAEVVKERRKSKKVISKKNADLEKITKAHEISDEKRADKKELRNLIQEYNTLEDRTSKKGKFILNQIKELTDKLK
jgi:hypothetical protein